MSPDNLKIVTVNSFMPGAISQSAFTEIEFTAIGIRQVGGDHHHIITAPTLEGADTPRWVIAKHLESITEQSRIVFAEVNERFIMLIQSLVASVCQ